MPDLADTLKIEQNFADQVAAALVSANVPAVAMLGVTNLPEPRVEVLVGDVQQASDHMAFDSGTPFYDHFQCSLRLNSVTRRTDGQSASNAAGLVRSLLARQSALLNANGNSLYYVLDLREIGTATDTDDSRDLDTTAFVYSCQLQVRA
jgi:hypothetical protein